MERFNDETLRGKGEGRRASGSQATHGENGMDDET